MKMFALLIAFAALMPVANAEQGDAEDRAITEQMMHEAQATKATKALSTSGYGDAGKANVQAGQTESKKKDDASETSDGQ